MLEKPHAMRNYLITFLLLLSFFGVISPHSTSRLFYQLSQLALSSTSTLSLSLESSSALSAANFHFSRSQISMSQVPPGFIFQPTKEVLLLYYLLPKVTNKPLPSPNPVKEKDLYKDCPDKIWDELIKGQSFGNSDFFFFTKLKQIKERINRTVDAGGKWSQEDNEEVWSSDTNKKIGNRRRFSFQNDTNKSTGNKHGGWVMYEYRLKDSMLPASSGDNNRSYVLCQLRKNKTNSRKRKAQPQFQDFHSKAAFPSSSNLNQTITQASNSEPEPGDIEISGAQSYQPQPQLQDSPTDVVFPSSGAQFFQPQLQVQDSLTNCVPSSFNPASFWTTNPGLEQGEIEISGTQIQPLLQLQDPPPNSVVPSNSNCYQPVLSTTDSEYEQRDTEISVAQSQPQLQLQNTVVPSIFDPSPLFLSTTNSEHEQGKIERSGTWFQPQPGHFASYYFPIESYGAQSQPQPQTDGSDIGAVVHPYTISTGVSTGRLG